ncbi:hypothetical protein ACIP98_34230 [Streptomyces sp. NPDC088354]|uniref:hypothetical protein n=1 Tax=Streptomyces sp. NPDC088354 TaxID=3365856 RepID=UPI0037F5DCB4
MISDPAIEGGLRHPLGQLLQKPALAGQLQPARAGSVDQLPDQLIIQHVRRQLDRPDLFNRLDRGSHVADQVFFLDRDVNRSFCSPQLRPTGKWIM